MIKERKINVISRLLFKKSITITRIKVQYYPPSSRAHSIAVHNNVIILLLLCCAYRDIPSQNFPRHRRMCTRLSFVVVCHRKTSIIVRHSYTVIAVRKKKKLVLNGFSPFPCPRRFYGIRTIMEKL